MALAGDVRDEAWNETMVARTVEAFGGLDILVVNAGRQQYRDDLSDFSTSDFDDEDQPVCLALAMSGGDSGHARRCRHHHYGVYSGL